jgi:hypothetical protein
VPAASLPSRSSDPARRLLRRPRRSPHPASAGPDTASPRCRAHPVTFGAWSIRRGLWLQR